MSNLWSANRRKACGLALGTAAALAATMGIAPAADMPSRKKVAVAPAPVEEAKPVYDFAFGFRVASDYNFRGISQSDRGFSPQGYGELQLFDNFLYAGVAGYGVDLPTKPLAEIDLTAGIRPK